MDARTKEQYGQLQADIGRYTRVNQKIEEVQKQLTEVKGQIVDLGNRTLRVGTLETTIKEGVGSSLAFPSLGCQPSVLSEGSKVADWCTGALLRPFFFISALSRAT